MTYTFLSVFSLPSSLFSLLSSLFSLLSLQGLIPGLRNEDIKVQLSSKGDVLTISGARLPTAKELNLMRRQMQREHRSSVEALLRLGAGRYVYMHMLM